MKLCCVCEKNPVDSREHVWPRWYLSYLDDLGPPASGWAVNGVPVTDRAGRAIRTGFRQRVLLPVCGDCNNCLNSRFEVPAKEAILRLVSNRWAGYATRAEWQAIGLWFAKVLLLLGHPLARHEHPAIDDVAVRFDGDHPDYGWMLDGSPPPEGLSLWVYHCDMDDQTTHYRVPLPKVVCTSDGDQSFEIMTLGTAGLDVTLVWHPGWPIAHPLDSQGAGWELLHSAPEGGDLASLPSFGPKCVAWTAFSPTLREGCTLDGSLPPLSATESWPAAPEIMDVLEACDF